MISEHDENVAMVHHNAGHLHPGLLDLPAGRTIMGYFAAFLAGVGTATVVWGWIYAGTLNELRELKGIQESVRRSAKFPSIY